MTKSHFKNQQPNIVTLSKKTVSIYSTDDQQISQLIDKKAKQFMNKKLKFH